MRFLHTGDLHLDSAFCTYGARDAEAQREEGRALLRRVFECAKQEECQMILVAGDLFDSKFVSPETDELFCSLVEDCGIPVVVSTGNHDPYSENSFYSKASQRLGERLLLFTSPELQVFDIDELKVRVFGYSFTSPSLTVSPLDNADIPEDNGYLKIFCGHGDIDAPLSRYSPIMLSKLEELGFAYSALGHVHNAKEFEDSEGRVRYSGFGEGRAFDEIGEGGIWIVDADRDSCECRRIILSKKAFYICELELSPEDSRDSIEKKIKDSLEQMNVVDRAYVRVILSGMADGNEISVLAARKEELCRNLGCEYIELVDHAMPLIDGSYLERDTTLRGELYRILRPQLMSQDADERALAIRALKIGLAAIDGRNIFGASTDGGIG